MGVGFLEHGGMAELVECARLEIVCGASHPGFESLSLRHFLSETKKNG